MEKEIPFSCLRYATAQKRPSDSSNYVIKISEPYINTHLPIWIIEYKNRFSSVKVNIRASINFQEDWVTI